MMKYLILLEPTDVGFAVQVPDLAISTHGHALEAAKRAAVEAIQVNLETYRQTGQEVPSRSPVAAHLENPTFQDLLFAYVEVTLPEERLAA